MSKVSTIVASPSTWWRRTFEYLKLLVSPLQLLLQKVCCIGGRVLHEYREAHLNQKLLKQLCLVEIGFIVEKVCSLSIVIMALFR